MITNKDIRVENGNIVINGDKYPLDGQSPEAIMQIVEDNSDTTPTENSNAPVTSGGVYTAIDDAVNIVSVPDSFITLESDITIQTNRLYKQGRHIFGWITFSFSAQLPDSLKIGVINDEYRPEGRIIRMIAGLGTDAWKCDHIGYCIKDIDHSLSVTGYDSGIKAAHLHIDYVI